MRKLYSRKTDWLGVIGALTPKNPRALLGVVSSLRHRNFAIYFVGTGVSLIGTWMQQVAMGWMVFNMTNSAFLLSLSVFLSQIPALFFTPFGGMLSDNFPRRKILFCTQSLMMLQSGILAALTLLGVITLWEIFALCFFMGVILSFDAPTRQSFYSELVPPEDLSNAIALNSAVINGTRFIGPALGGLTIAALGEGWCFLTNAVLYMAILMSLFMIKLPKFKKSHKSLGIFAEIKEGASYVAKSVPIRALLGMLLVFCFFGAPFPMLLPAFVKGELGGSSETLGYMMSAVGAGAVSASLYLAARKRILGLGRVIVVSAALFGVSLFAISFVNSVVPAYILGYPIGFGVIAVAATTNTMLQSLVEDSKRGRVMSFFSMIFFGIAPIGSIAQGWLSNFLGFRTVSAIFGLVCVAAAFVFEKYRPAIRSHARKIYAEKGLIIPEIARGLQSSVRKGG